MIPHILGLTTLFGICYNRGTLNNKLRGQMDSIAAITTRRKRLRYWIGRLQEEITTLRADLGGYSKSQRELLSLRVHSLHHIKEELEDIHNLLEDDIITLLTEISAFGENPPLTESDPPQKQQEN